MACPCTDPLCPLADIGWQLCSGCDLHHAEDRPCASGEIAPGVTASPHRLGGKPCLTGTRMSTAQVYRMMQDYGREFIRQGWPYLTDEQIATACDYETSRH